MRTCRVCRERYTPARALQAVCSTTCAITAAARKREKAAAEDRRQTRAALVKLKSRAELVKEAQTAFNAWIRARDAHLPCVSCGRHHNGQYHAGHYRSTASRPDLRLDPANVHKQCAPCNTHLSGNLIPYRLELIARVGQAEVDRLEGPPTGNKLTRDELIALKAEYTAKTRKALEAE